MLDFIATLLLLQNKTSDIFILLNANIHPIFDIVMHATEFDVFLLHYTQA